MRVLDLRPWTVRTMSSLWSSGRRIRGRLPEDPGTPGFPGDLAGRVADGLVARRVRGRSKADVGAFIVSVGNLALGGTGKTPVVAALAADLAKAGKRGAILTRGFGSPLTGPLTVSPDNHLAGDEARMMAAALKSHGWPVIQARRRLEGLKFLLKENSGVEIVIVEDGHQTANLGRDLDILILDCWVVDSAAGVPHVKPVTGPVMPLGPWRESAAGADRAGIWLLESNDDNLPDGLNGQSVTTFQRSLSLRNEGTGEMATGRGQRVVALSGIAKPEAFEASLEMVLEGKPVLAVRCGDHAQYAPRMVDRITRAFREARGDCLVTTAKDWIKLKPFWPGELPVVLAELEIRWGTNRTLPELVGERLGS